MINFTLIIAMILNILILILAINMLFYALTSYYFNQGYNTALEDYQLKFPNQLKRKGKNK
ncbi:hypothetical protein J8J04_02870 ['Fragaria x ananassa' phyllody phytoplasma]|uniref:Uncharacterized protein n=1 Tax='Fragaria x ananassa' phyllody phytoplasma TaxID=2358428 RepID=A0ABS5K3V9_9MOLU|nr:hypothetical protein ['Fragaria x ananassa' phyllody phytoplasma]MBS2126611.1 hypothetical protein ['Fragaria x ananassa' phyllody phytoplasma]